MDSELLIDNLLLARVSDWGDCFNAAKDAIEKFVHEHARLVSKRNSQFLDYVPRLVDLAAERLGNSFGEDSNSLDDIPPVVLGSYIWKWYDKIPYATFRRGLLCLSSDPKKNGEPNDIDEWVLLNEKWLRDGRHNEWQHGLVTLSDADSVFPSSTANTSSRTITRQGPLSGYEILCEAREPRITIQPSVEAFKRTFEHMSDGLLKNLDWNNVLVAGGIVFGTLLSVDTTDGRPRRDPRWDSSDIDIYIYGLSPNEANEKVKHIFKTFCANLPAGTQTLVVRNCSTITFYAKYPLRRIQIVLKLVESPKTVLLNFDLDVCAMGWDGTALWMLPRAARALEMGCNVFTMNLIHGHYLSDRRASTQERIFKYADKGYGIRILPSYVSSLATRESDSDDSTSEPRNFDIVSIAAKQRDWVTTKVGGKKEVGFVGTLMHSRVRYRSSQCLNGFRIFMRCATLWEMAHQGTVSLRSDAWASTGYDQHALKSYDDAPNLLYKWDKNFNLESFQKELHWSNKTDTWGWSNTDDYYRLEPHGVWKDTDLNKYRRMSCAPTVDALLSRENDLMLQVLLPREFAVYANKVVREAQAQAGLPKTQILTPAVSGFTAEEPGSEEGFFFWRIRKELMWQQLDRRVDEVFEMLHAFRRVNEHLRYPDPQARRFRAELARRQVYDEFDAFSRWMQDESLLAEKRRRYYDPYDSDGSGGFDGYDSGDFGS
ncbi:hypothetical protein K438DRAFT_2006765 [Mycena galopus ATCC 62051]|nr:hypothetical protein K438DRAFT_2006765 [Mycena galopus ATCC 62051]